MSTITASDAAKAVVRRNTEEVQSGGNFDVFEELFADDFVDLIILAPSRVEFLTATAIPARDNAAAPTEPSAAAVWNFHKFAVGNRILFN